MFVHIILALDMTHPISIYLSGGFFFFGLTMLLFAVKVSFWVFDQFSNCAAVIKVGIVSMTLAYSSQILMLMYRAEASLAAETHLKKLLTYFFCPFLVIDCIIMLILGNLDHFYNVVIQDIDGKLFCHGSPAAMFTLFFIIGDMRSALDCFCFSVSQCED
jgi:hypothetical protein